MIERKELYIITGFLGSGKTTLLKSILEKFNKINTGVIVNEFGKIGIDGELIEKENMDLIEINNGSIFCICLENAFIEALNDLLKCNLDKIFVETSGLSDPSNLDKIIKATRELSDNKLVYKGSICIVNANNILKIFNTNKAVKKQIIFSDLIIINKIDLVSSQTIKKAKKMIKKINHFANIIETTYSKFDFEKLDEYLVLEKLDKNSNLSKETINKKGNKPFTYVFNFKETVELENFRKFLKEISKKIFRVKGFIKGKDGSYYIDMIGDEINYYSLNVERESAKLIMLSTKKVPMKEWINSKWENIFK